MHYHYLGPYVAADFMFSEDIENAVYNMPLGNPTYPRAMPSFLLWAHQFGLLHLGCDLVEVNLGKVALNLVARLARIHIANLPEIGHSPHIEISKRLR